MARPKDNHLRSRQDGFDENFDLAAADQAAFSHRFIRQVEAHDARFFVSQNVLCGGPNLRFDAATADRSHGRAVVANQHFSGLKARDRPADLNNGGEGRFAAFLPQALNFIEDVNFHKPLSLTYSLTLLIPTRRLAPFYVRDSDTQISS